MFCERVGCSVALLLYVACKKSRITRSVSSWLIAAGSSYLTIDEGAISRKGGEFLASGVVLPEETLRFQPSST